MRGLIRKVFILVIEIFWIRFVGVRQSQISDDEAATVKKCQQFRLTFVPP